MNDAPALSAAQVGIAVDGATDAAKNAADLILTEPGLSPIYGAVLESRRIFARIKGELSNVGLIFAQGDQNSHNQHILFSLCHLSCRCIHGVGSLALNRDLCNWLLC